MKNSKIQMIKIDSKGNEWYLVKSKSINWPNGQPCKLVYKDKHSMSQLIERFNEDGLKIGSRTI